MKVPLALLLVASVAAAPAADLKKVSFLVDTVTELDGRVVKFLSGSVWLLDREIVGIPLGKGVIVCSGAAPKYEEGKIEEYMKALPKAGVFLYRRQSVGAKAISGAYILTSGYLTEVVAAHGKGAILETDDGSLWSIPEYDQYDTSYWLPPYRVIVFESEQYLLNLDEGKKVWIDKRIK